MFRFASKLALAALLALALFAPAANAGTTYSPLDECHDVWSHSRMTFYRTFDAYEWAEVTAIGDGDTDLDLYVYDQRGNLVAIDDDLTDYCVASWIPEYRQRYQIVILNRGSVYNRVCIGSN